MKHNLKEMVKQTPLSIRLKVMSEMAFINLITELGFREDKYWNEDDVEMLDKLLSLARKFSKEILEEIDTWTNDGCPE